MCCRTDRQNFFHATRRGASRKSSTCELTTLGTMFSRIENMRVVPFDLRSFGQLVGPTFGAMATLLPLLHANGDLANIAEAIGKLLGRLSSGG